ncbi:MAG: HipA domain-containing protein [Deltaproteobacteria bacterium]|nr:HipA domain-containing protein [Deltaproteobacteria bacterium]
MIRDACGDDARDDFLTRLAFVVASGNDDAHLKNWSFQWGHEHRPWLSPCYDQVATLTWRLKETWRSSEGPTLALALGKEKRFSDITRSHVRTLTRRCEAKHGEERFMSGLERARATWPMAATRAPGAMIQAIQRLWAVVPILKEVGPLP